MWWNLLLPPVKLPLPTTTPPPPASPARACCRPIWTSGPLAAGSYEFEIWAAAGQCDLGKGTLVGSMALSYNGTSADVTYTMLPGFTLDETHLYVGSAPLPSFKGEYTVAPGQYGNIHDLEAATSDSFRINNLSGNIHVVAHAVACSNNW